MCGDDPTRPGLCGGVSEAADRRTITHEKHAQQPGRGDPRHWDCRLTIGIERSVGREGQAHGRQGRRRCPRGVLGDLERRDRPVRLDIGREPVRHARRHRVSMLTQPPSQPAQVVGGQHGGIVSADPLRADHLDARLLWAVRHASRQLPTQGQGTQPLHQGEYGRPDRHQRRHGRGRHQKAEVMRTGAESRLADEIFTVVRGIPDDDRFFIRDLDLRPLAADRQTGTRRARPSQQGQGQQNGDQCRHAQAFLSRHHRPSPPVDSPAPACCIHSWGVRANTAMS
jgi:hypothetical protein